MAVSVFDLFKPGIGPSSSHTVGPMRAAAMFVNALRQADVLPSTASLKVELYGSLGVTGKGHGTDTGIILGLMGFAPDTVDATAIAPLVDGVRQQGALPLAGGRSIAFREDVELIFHRRQTLKEHPNGMQFSAFDDAGNLLRQEKYFSVGGGFVVRSGGHTERDFPGHDRVPYPFESGDQLLGLCREHGLSISQIMLANEATWRSAPEIRNKILDIWHIMQSCVTRGFSITGTLPGPFHVPRRAAVLASHLRSKAAQTVHDPLLAMDWVNAYAIAVNEENAAGGRVVTAPTNGAAGVIPAVLHYYRHFVDQASEEGVIDFLLTAGAIGILYKLNASISGAEVGCQGEVGVACSMAAAGLVAALGGSPEQIENAAEIGMEHNLGLTCDPVGGLVQVPCIERNAMGAVKAINAARLALQGDGSHVVSLDKVIKTMRETGADMKSKYKETSRGGLAVNIVEC